MFDKSITILTHIITVTFFGESAVLSLRELEQGFSIIWLTIFAVSSAALALQAIHLLDNITKDYHG